MSLNNDAKEPYCQWAFGKNRHSPKAGKDAFAVQRLMEDLYPRTAKYVWQKKKGGHEGFSHESQGFEASIFVDGILRELARRKIPALTIHDCLVSREEDRDEVLEIAENTFKEKGIRARFKKE